MTLGPALRPTLALALAAMVSLGLARFSYALLLPPMRAELGWSYFTAGAMNTANAAGYLLGALLAPRALRHIDARRWMLGGGYIAALLLALHGATTDDTWLALLRGASGAASAAGFVGAGLLAARLSTANAGASGLILGLTYGGVGLGIVTSALVVPALLALGEGRWRLAWVLLGVIAALATAVTARGTRGLRQAPDAGAPRERAPWAPMGCALLGYLCFGLGYIGYMTFVVTLLREQGLSTPAITAFYALLGLGVVASSWIWAGWLVRHRGGGALARLNALLALATVLPVLSAHPLTVFGSGLLFGGVFLSVVASTTAFVRHNLPPAAWPAGIAGFTIVFAAGQIAGPSLVGWVADGAGGLARGFVLSAACLAAGALIAALQRPLSQSITR